MGQKNNVICSYLSNPAVFADFINGSIHHGKKVVLAHQIVDREAVSYTKEELGRLLQGSQNISKGNATP